MHRLVPSPVDARIREFLSRHDPAGQAGLGEEDSYTLMDFARRSVLGVLRDREDASLDEARAALAAVDREAVDFRDVIVTSQLVEWAGGGRGPRAGMWVRIDTPDGPALAMDMSFEYRPGATVVAMAFRILEALEQDAYVAGSLAVNDGVPAVWLSKDAGEAVSRARGGISVDGALDPAVSRRAHEQMFTAFLTESATAEDAERIASAALSTDEYEALGLAHGTVSCVVVARSFVVGTPSFETAGALERFREPFARALEGAG